MAWLAGRSGLVVLLSSAAIIGAVVIRLPGPYPWVAVAAAGALLAAFAFPLPVAIFGWGATLPIWSIGPLPPEVFDAARYGLGLIVASRAWASSNPSNHALRRWAFPLAVVAVFVTVLSWWHEQSPTAGVIMFASVALVSVTLWRIADIWPLLIGFASAAAVSAAVLIGTAAGAGTAQMLVPNVNPGVGRFTGLGTAAPVVSVEFAVAAVVFWCALEARLIPRLVGLPGITLSVLALLVSGGRTGLLGLGLVVAFLIMRGWVSPRIAASLTLAVGASAYWVTQHDIAFNTLVRLTTADASGADFTAGRIDRLLEGWSRFVQSPILGSGSATHFAPLTFGLTGGIVAAVIITALSFRLVAMTIAGPGRYTSPLGRAGALIAVVLTVMAVLETTGPFLGVEMLALLFAAVIATSRERTGAIANASETGPGEQGIKSVVASDLVRKTPGL